MVIEICGQACMTFMSIFLGFHIAHQGLKVNTYLEGFAIVSDIFSGRTIFVPYQMSAIEKFSFCSPNNSEKLNKYYLGYGKDIIF